MSMPVRFVLLFLLTPACVHLDAAEPAEIASLRTKAEKGNALAQYNLGLAYTQGRLVPANLPEAFVWLSLASENGATGKALDSVLGSITDEQLAEGRRRLELRRTTLPASAASRRNTPKLTARGFSLNAPPTSDSPVVNSGPPAPDPKTPEVFVPTTPSQVESPGPGELAALRREKQQLSDELAQTRKDLAQARADLQAASAELTVLRSSLARHENTAEKPKAENPAPRIP